MVFCHRTFVERDGTKAGLRAVVGILLLRGIYF